MSAARQTDALVVGAGPTGLVAALSLAKAGLSVEVIDEAWRPAGHSYALALHPRSLHLLDELGWPRRRSSSGRKLPSLTLLAGDEPRRSLRCGARDERFPYLLSLPQSGLERLLTDALARLGVKVRWSHRLASLEPDGDARRRHGGEAREGVGRLRRGSHRVGRGRDAVLPRRLRDRRRRPPLARAAGARHAARRGRAVPGLRDLRVPRRRTRATRSGSCCARTR